MLNEHDREDGPEDGEYHFSDEGGYESGEEEAKAPVVSESSSLAEKFSSYRRFVIIGAIAAVVFLVAYLIIPPLTTSTPTEITAVNTPPPVTEVSPAPVSAPPKTLAVEEPSLAPAAEKPKLTSEFKHLVAEEKEKLAEEKSKVMAHFGQTAPVPMPPMEQAAPANAPPAETGLALATSPVLSASAQEFIAAPVGSLSPGPAAQASAESRAALDRLTAMEETNTKLIGQLHAEYAQKVADYEAQNKALQEQVHTLNGRLAGMEAEMSKLVQALNNKHSVPTAASETMTAMADNSSVVLQGSPSAVQAPNPSGPSPQGGYKSNYTVQAIIPGRAWLRTESGETITVAEGDMLKSLGRVTKIDPYDGTIIIDTGSKLLTLTYGNGDYA